MVGHEFQIGTAASKAKWKNPAKDVDYNFRPSLDGDVISTQKNLGDAESALNHHWVIDDLQLESDVKVDSDPICSSAGCGQYKHKKKPRGYDINYPVPNFGVDHEILDSHHSLAISEGALAHKLEMGTDASKAKWHNVAKDTDYNFRPKLDGDMISTAKHLGDAENTLGHKWVIDDLQIESDVHSDPICSSAGCSQYKHKKKPRGYDINYPVPNFGVDHDILDNHHSLEVSEGALGHKLIMGTDASKAKWHNVAKDTDYNFRPKLDGDMVSTAKHLGDAENTLGHKWVIDDLQIDSDVTSDPICSSAGCSQYKHKKKPRGYDINYPVPNFGVDHEILDSHHSLAISEGALSHKLEMGTDASKAKWHNPAKDTDYNFRPKLDGDMISTAKHLGDAENTLGHKWVIDDLQLESNVDLESDPICSSAGCT